MQLKKRSTSAKGGEGSVVLSMQTDEDAWHAYNLIAVGDELKAPTRRAVRACGGDAQCCEACMC